MVVMVYHIIAYTAITSAVEQNPEILGAMQMTEIWSDTSRYTASDQMHKGFLFYLLNRQT